MIEQLHLQQTNRPCDTLVFWNRDPDRLLLNTPYQRGDVWGVKRRRNFIRSILLGIPIPSMILNDRMAADWQNDFRMAVIDGKQRITTLLMLFSDQLTVPGEWFGDSRDMIRYSELPRRMQRRIENTPLPFSEGRLPNIEEEQRVFDLVNFGGLAQGERDDDSLETTP